MTVPIYIEEYDPQSIFQENDPNNYQIIDVRNYITTYRRNRPRSYRPFTRSYYNYCNNKTTVYYNDDEDDDYNEESNIGSDELAIIRSNDPVEYENIINKNRKCAVRRLYNMLFKLHLTYPSSYRHIDRDKSDASQMQVRCKSDASQMQVRCKPDANQMQARCNLGHVDLFPLF
ncbi:uncharacterized protein LOC124954166 isoform X1 [Vespa velutina]|uniref:uncharacterized protein LOC124954166 isoform X1 n=1 Tax=Vespa velutina TaxID=202808 RepID=UPI001FB4AEE9|nr:uncharacterized protein LOC124954166 isoform X1 [Vespa velutina]